MRAACPRPLPLQVSPADAQAALGIGLLARTPLCQGGRLSPGPHWHRWKLSAPGLPEGLASCEGQSQVFRCQFLPLQAWLLFF